MEITKKQYEKIEKYLPIQRGKQAIGKSRGGLTTKIHMVSASDKAALTFSLSSGRFT